MCIYMYIYIYIYIYISEENKFGVILLPIIEKQAVIDNTGEINYLKFIVLPYVSTTYGLSSSGAI